MSALSGKKTVTAAGTAEALGSGQVHGALMVKALIGNVDTVYIGNDGAGDVASTNGLELSAGDVVIFDHVSNLAAIMLDAAQNGEGVTWIILTG